MKNIIFIAIFLAVGGMGKPIMNHNEVMTEDALEPELEAQLKKSSVCRN